METSRGVSDGDAGKFESTGNISVCSVSNILVHVASEPSDALDIQNSLDSICSVRVFSFWGVVGGVTMFIGGVAAALGEEFGEVIDS